MTTRTQNQIDTKDWKFLSLEDPSHSEIIQNLFSEEFLEMLIEEAISQSATSPSFPIHKEEYTALKETLSNDNSFTFPDFSGISQEEIILTEENFAFVHGDDAVLYCNFQEFQKQNNF